MPAILPCTPSSYSVLFSVADWGPCLWSGSWADERSGTDEPWYLDRKQLPQDRTAGSGADELECRSRRGPDIGADVQAGLLPAGLPVDDGGGRGEVARRRPTSGWRRPGPSLLLVVAGASVSVSVLVRVLSRSVAGYVPVAYSCTAVIEVCLQTTTTTATYNTTVTTTGRRFAQLADSVIIDNSRPRPTSTDISISSYNIEKGLAHAGALDGFFFG